MMCVVSTQQTHLEYSVQPDFQTDSDKLEETHREGQSERQSSNRQIPSLFRDKNYTHGKKFQEGAFWPDIKEVSKR